MWALLTGVRIASGHGAEVEGQGSPKSQRLSTELPVQGAGRARASFLLLLPPRQGPSESL